MLLQLHSSDITCMRVWSAATLLSEQTGVAVTTYSCTWEVPHPDQHHRLDWVVCGFCYFDI